MIELLNIDCMDYMAGCKDNAFELAIVDPPYGIGIVKRGTVGGKKLAVVSQYKKSDWDNATPNYEYFVEILRVSKNQIVWGGNYFIDKLNSTPCFIVWDKINSGNFADCELAWTSFTTATRLFRFMWNGMLQGDMKTKEIRIHPTQKPVALYAWLLKNYANPGDRNKDGYFNRR